MIEIEVWRINDSEPAPKFSIIERPNDWAKAMKKSSDLSESASLKQEFWHEFNNNADSNATFTKNFKLRSPQAQHWYDLAVGSSAYHIDMTVNTQKNVITAGIYINDDKTIFGKFRDHADEIEKELGATVEWRDAKKASRFFVSQPFDINKREDWAQGFSWLYDMCLKIKAVIRNYDK